MLAEAKNIQDELIRLRRVFHATPELSFEEIETRKIIIDYLKDLGFKIRDGFISTSVVAEIGAAPFIALRSDMDALPIQEQNISPYVSRNMGVMHACGHDAHMSCLLGAAKLIASRKHELRKGVRLIFEPGSESLERSGAKELIDAGVLRDVEGIFGFHVDSTVPAFNVVVVKEVGIHSSKISITTKPSSGQTFDDAVVGNAKLVSKLTDSFGGACGRTSLKRLFFTNLESTAGGGLHLAATINAESAENLSTMLKDIQQICESEGSGIDGTSNDSPGEAAPPSQAVTGQFLLSLAEGICAQEKTKLSTRRTWSKEFEIYGQYVPAAYFYLGTACGKLTHHSSNFEIDERTLYLATAILSQAAIRSAS